MRNTGIILLFFISLLANGVLGFSFFGANRQIVVLQQTVTEKQLKINQTITEYNDLVVLYKQRNNEITQLQSQIASYKVDLNNYRDRLSKADYFVSRAKCTVMVDELKAYAATSNAEIKKPILTALQAVYSGKITSSNFTTYWDNNKSAMLTTIWGNSGSTKTIVSWSERGLAIQTIYDVNSGCIMYTGDR